MRVFVDFLEPGHLGSLTDSFKERKDNRLSGRLSVGCLPFPCLKENYEVSYGGGETAADGNHMGNAGLPPPPLPSLLKGEDEGPELRNKLGSLGAVQRWTKMAR